MNSTNQPLTVDFNQIALKDIPTVGGKNASLGQLFNNLRPLGINVPDGFAITAESYRQFLKQNDLESRLRAIFANLDFEDVNELAKRGSQARTAILATTLPEELKEAILASYTQLCQRLGREPELAVRSSATAEDLPDASFAGAQETFLNVRGPEHLLKAVVGCYASLFTDRAISYRARLGYDQLQVYLSVGVQPMVRSDKACSGVIFTLDTESGFRDAVIVSSSYGLGEFIVQGIATPDEWIVFKPTLKTGHQPIIGRRLGEKAVRLIYGDETHPTRSVAVHEKDRARFSLTDEEVLKLARWACLVEDHYSRLAGRPQPMDIEWAKDGLTGEFFVVQARPETVHSAKSRQAFAEVYKLTATPGPVLVKGQAVGEKIGQGRVRVVKEVSGLEAVQAGEVLVAERTDPDWEPAMKKIAAIITDQGGRTAHAAIVSRELGLPCIVGTGQGTSTLHDGDEVTVVCSEGEEGHVYAGLLPFTTEKVNAAVLPETRTRVMMNVGDPEKAFSNSFIPNSGVGLARLEFIINNHIGIHPMALARYPDLKDKQARREIKARIGQEDPKEYFVRRLSEGIGRIAAAFYPKPVIVRMSDFKTNEYAELLGGAEFEPKEENPMLGFRGASRYYDPRYAEGFALECAALLAVREVMGLTNVKVMIPFCRTVEEARKVIETMAANGLHQGKNGLEVYAMCEIPANVVLASEFLRVFDGYSIGSNDLTQLVLGIDRDSGTVAHLFDERNQAVTQMIYQVIEAAHKAGKPIGICGQAPSDYPEFAGWLVECGITSISLNPDAVIKTIQVIAKEEAQQKHFALIK
ncbi:MAG: phosphoenolpyruvate synthase [Chloroflexi bacterium]|nr:phosphoenolpyruvate synthase [Chloroflexota bacterium]OJV90216.1 MAG: phosphoenolpyruvate synthase [Chloroflexi bacterium 54-19]